MFPSQLDDRITDASDLESIRQTIADTARSWDGGRFNPDCRHQRVAANDAVNAIDDALRMLHRLRSELVTEIRRYDAESVRRTDELLALIRSDRERTKPEGLQAL